MATDKGGPMRERSGPAGTAFRRATLGLMLLLGLPVLWAAEVTLTYLEGQLPVAPDAVTSLGPNLFGDRVNLYNGSLEFEHTDLSLPGNSALGVALGRRHTPGRSLDVRGQFGDWDLAVPRISGTFATSKGWVTQSGGTNRCSGWSLPPVVSSASTLSLSPVAPASGTLEGAKAGSPPSPTRLAPAPDETTLTTTIVGFIASDYWQGTNLDVPGQGSQEILTRAAAYTAAPGDDPSYRLVTRNNWQITCLATLKNAAGEGFFAVSPDGVRYRFDWMASRLQVSAGKQGATLGRTEMFLMATEVADRFGNWVRYTYDSAAPLNLVNIRSSDDRLITVTHAGGRVVSATDRTRTFTYGYSPQGRLSYVQQADGSRWTFNLGPMTYPAIGELGEDASCEHPGGFPSALLVGTITHPSGAVGTFTTEFRLHGRTYVERVCKYVLNSKTLTTGAVWPRLTISQTLVSKVITGPGIAPMSWAYSHTGVSGWTTCTTCADRKVVTVTDPAGIVNRHSFGIRWRVNEGQLLQLDEGWNGSTALRTTVYRYRTAALQAYPEQFGTTLLKNSDDLATRNRPQDRRIITQQGATFTWEAAAGTVGLDRFARATRVTLSSSLGHAKTETTAYSDHSGKWVLGQVASVTDDLGVRQSTTYDAVTALPTALLRFGLLLQTYAYHADGTLHRAYDPLGRATTWINYKRGLAQNITHRDAEQESAAINNLGKPDRHTNAAGFTTSYAYDSMGRLARIDPPAESTFQYHPTLNVFEAVPAGEYGLAAGHWRQTTSKGNARIARYYDALWRVRGVHTYDAADAANTSKVVEFRYDHEGHKTFESYPQRTLTGVDTTVAGTRWVFDGLAREVAKHQDSELGVLTTTSEYLSGFTRRVTNPRSKATTFAFQAFDQPTEEHIKSLALPEPVWLTITRDIHGKPTAIARGGSYAGLAQQATRRYVYDKYQRLCKTIEPETGATVQAYDGAGNLDWRASGQALAGTSSCDDTAVPATARVNFDYDARDRLTSTTYGDGSPGIGRAYTTDGLLSSIWSGSSQWNYVYNKARLLTHETLYFAGQPYPFSRVIDPHANVSSLSYPTGITVQYAPNALGQPTELSGYTPSRNVRYYPNGALAGYTLNNGVVHAVTQNLRGLPATWSDSGVMNDSYAYDANGNVSAITDAQEGLSSRAMGYDGLDRLVSASGIWGTGIYGYDALDNLRASTVGSRTTQSTVDAATNRLTQLNVNGQLQAFGYDANGNLTQRGAQTFGFDIGNRLYTAPGKANYAYDGHGRRTWVAYASGATRLQAYSQAGKLLLSVDSQKGVTSHIHLGDKLIAEVNSQTGTRYSHTDALGSPVATTNSARQVLTRTRYEPYGATAAGTNPTGIGFTGHVNDADTGLVYMQQRYYEPLAGRFLSVDPVTTDAKTAEHFNRYAYGNNNPYRYTDPEGRVPIPVILKALDLAVTAAEVYSAATTGGGMAAARAVGEALASNAIPGSKVAGAVGKALGRVGDVAKEIALSRKVHGEAARHADDAIRGGKQDVLTVDRSGAVSNRHASTGPVEKVPGKHLDEYPPAMFKEGGAGASVRAINPRDNMSAGACIGNACRGLPDGAQVRIKVED